MQSCMCAQKQHAYTTPMLGTDFCSTLFQIAFSLPIAFSTSLECSVIKMRLAVPVPVDTAVSLKAQLRIQCHNFRTEYFLWKTLFQISQFCLAKAARILVGRIIRSSLGQNKDNRQTGRQTHTHTKQVTLAAHAPRVSYSKEASIESLLIKLRSCSCIVANYAIRATSQFVADYYGNTNTKVSDSEEEELSKATLWKFSPYTVFIILIRAPLNRIYSQIEVSASSADEKFKSSLEYKPCSCHC